MDPIAFWSGLLTVGMTIISGFLKRALNRADRLEDKVERLELSVARDYHNKADVKEIVQTAITPLRDSLRRIETHITGESDLGFGRLTGRRRAIPDDGN